MFILSPYNGLCNQLQSIAKGILLAQKYNINIISTRINMCRLRRPYHYKLTQL